MIKIITTEEKSNSFIPKIWKLTDDPYKAYRCENQTSKATLNVFDTFDPNLPSRIILTKKGRALITNCDEDKDQKIGLITCRGGFRGYLNVKFYNCEVIVAGSYSEKHCAPIHQFAVLFYNTIKNDSDNESKILMRTNYRGGPLNDITLITWNKIINDNDYPVEEFEFPENGKIIEGNKFNYYLTSSQRKIILETAKAAADLNYGVYIGIDIRHGKSAIQLPVPELKFYKDCQQKNYICFSKDKDFEKTKNDIITYLKFQSE